MTVTSQGLRRSPALRHAPRPHARISGIGGYRPRRVVPNAEIVERDRLQRRVDPQRSGIIERRWAGAERDRASRCRSPPPGKALETAGIDAAPDRLRRRRHRHRTCSRPRPSPPPSPHELGTDQAAAFDISAACAGFCHGIALGQRHGPRRQRRARPGDRRRAALRHHRPRRPRHGVHLRRRRRRGRRSARPTTAGIGPVVWGSDGEQFDLIRQTRGLARRAATENARHAAPDHAGPDRSSAGRRSRWPRSPSRRSTRPASPSTTSTCSSRTRPTCASSTRWSSS